MRKSSDLRLSLLITLILIFVFWLVCGAIFGFAGAFLGPGAVMVVAGLLQGVCGGMVHIIVRLAAVRLRWWNAGILVATVALVVTMIVIGGDTREPVIMIFLFLYYVVSATITFIIVDRVTDFESI